MEDKLAIIYCPPVKDYPTQPADMSKCTKESCIHCGQLMWLSKKKKIILEAARHVKRDEWLGCYDCFLKIAKEKHVSGEWDLNDITRINI